MLDLRYGGWAGKKEPNPFAERGATRVQSVHYGLLRRIFAAAAVPLLPDDVLVDVGCGRGRVINWWLHTGVRTPIYGLELVESVAARTGQRLARFPNVRILIGDALLTLPADGTLFYLYHPFGGETMRLFLERLRATAPNRPRVRVVYFNCAHLDAFDPAEWEVRMLPLGTPEPAAVATFVGVQRGAAE